MNEEFKLKLLSLGGVRVDEEDTGKFSVSSLEAGEAKLFDPYAEIDAVQVLVKAGLCHDNIMLLWHDVPELEVWTGHALDLKGIWVSHSWGWHSAYKLLIETTVPFVKYIGHKLKADFLRLEVGSSCEAHKTRLGLPTDLKKLLWDNTHKKCSRCQDEKLLTDFNLDRSEKTGLKNYCRACSKVYWGRWRNANREKVNQAARDYRAENPEASRARVRRSDLKTRFGLTPEDKDRMLLRQNGKCAICLDPFPTSSHACIDHCHVTNKLRGLLCSSCNNGLGRFKDSFSRIIRAADYIRKNS